MADEFVAYLLDGQTSETDRAFSVAPDKDKAIQSYNDAKSSANKGIAEAVEVQPQSEAPTDGFVALLDRALHLGLSQSHLITISNAARPIFRGSAARFEVLEPVMKQAVLVEKHDSFAIYGLTTPIYADLERRMRRLNSLDEALRDLPGTALMGMVATFDAFIADVVREMLGRYPDRYTLSDKEVCIKDVLQHGSFESFIAAMIDDDVYNFTRGSHEEQIRFIEKNFSIPVSAHWKSYPDYIEVFERRNLVAHGERTFNSRYVRICTAAGHKGAESILGQPVRMTTNYLRQSADLLLEFAVVLILTLWRKHDKSTEAVAFGKLNDVVFELIQSGRFRSAASIASAALDIKKSACTQLDRSMLTVNLASAQKHLKQNEAALKTLESVDWSAAADNFRVCVASLREDYDEVKALMRRVSAANLIDADSFRTWPVFSFARDNPEFQSVFQEVFGEPLVRVAESSPEALHDVTLRGPTMIH